MISLPKMAIYRQFRMRLNFQLLSDYIDFDFHLFMFNPSLVSGLISHYRMFSIIIESRIFIQINYQKLRMLQQPRMIHKKLEQRK
jgi:hypothetical protein